jgi:hypothetical protein
MEGWMKRSIGMAWVALVVAGAVGCRGNDAQSTGGSGGSGGEAGAAGSAGTGGSGGSSGSGGSGGMSGSGGSGGMTGMTIASLRQNPPGPGVSVSLQNVVVVGWVTASSNGKIWVQDQQVGPYSGIELYCKYTASGGGTPPCPMTRQQIRALQRGQVVNVNGVFDTFQPTSPANSPTTLELKNVLITATGAMSTPAAMPVAASDVAHDQVTQARYAGVYVQVTDGPFHVSSLTPLEFERAMCPSTGPDANTGAYYQGFEVQNTAGTTLAIAASFYESLTYCLSGCFTCSNPITNNQTFQTITGVVEPQSDSDTGQIYLQISPVTDGDIPRGQGT